MHGEAHSFMLYVKSLFPDFFNKKNVLDVGSGDINGNNRVLFTDSTYTGNDVSYGPNVTIISKTSALPFSSSTFDTIVSTECFEHDPEYALSMKKIYDMLKPGGLFAFTCASDGRNEHGTRRTTPNDSLATRENVEVWSDYYLNLNLSHLKTVFDLDNEFVQYGCYQNKSPCDLYFWAIKKGGVALSKPVVEYNGYAITQLHSPNS